MSSAKHTAGPWTVKNDYDERHIVIANIDGESFPDGTSSYTYDFVCDTYGDGDDDSRSREVADANARLIAAAPELLAALDAIEWAGVDDAEEGGHVECCPYCGAHKSFGIHESECLVGHALAKAEGRS